MSAPRTRRGPRAPNAKLSWREVAAIRELAGRDFSAQQIKATLELSCSEQTVRRVMNGETYHEGDAP